MPVGAQDAPGSTTAEGPGTATGVVDPVLVNSLDLVLVSPTAERAGLDRGAWKTDYTI